MQAKQLARRAQLFKECETRQTSLQNISDLTLTCARERACAGVRSAGARTDKVHATHS